MKCLLTALFMLAAWSACNLQDENSLEKKTDKDLRLIEEVANLVKSDYVDEIDPQKRFPPAFHSLLKSFDPFSAYLDEKDTGRFQGLLEGSLCQAGFWVSRSGNRFRISSCLPDSPAERAGLKVGDIVAAVNGRFLYGLPFWNGRLALVTATPEELTLMIQKSPDLPLTEIQIMTESLPLPVLEIRKGGIYWIYTSRITASSLAQVERIVKVPGRPRIVLDLRYFESLDFNLFLRFCRILLPSSVQLTLKTRDREQSWEVGGGGSSECRIVGVIDQSTILTAELLARICRELDIPLIGRPTGGFCQEQKVFSLDEGSNLLLTVGRYSLQNQPVPSMEALTPNVGIDVQKVQELFFAVNKQFNGMK